jgi:glycerol-3-phosphate dehydrogenase (NAD(P)+)
VGRRARLIVLAIPSEVTHVVVRELGKSLDGRHLVVHAIRGLAGDGLERVSEVVRKESAARRLGAVGGPTLADDLIAGRPSLLVVGSRFPEVRKAFIGAFGSESLRIYGTEDLVGLEWASAIVGCLAVAVGYAQAIGSSPGLIAGLVSRGIHEGARIAAAAGGEERTLLGLAGYGDLLACAGQPGRPEVAVGLALGRGQTLDQAIAAAKQRVEAIDLIPKIHAWTARHGVPAPIFNALTEGILRGKPSSEIIRSLMTAPIEEMA